VLDVIPVAVFGIGNMRVNARQAEFPFAKLLLLLFQKFMATEFLFEFTEFIFRYLFVENMERPIP
jgi:hypothetical protein